ncbi:hypothetical protein [Bifidobacterium parmae]|uniref:Uncharacterized protein n=1 Tax=Bifidobacterium parmae TaxID=361854 RepID=A0A2N5J6N0_9BIFI|nr:hypothetical protein [Bifidobacterium parmae]PLS29853.1 hypothetical protein Uis4E_0194 [Bifidobacterium parmae]
MMMVDMPDGLVADAPRGVPVDAGTAAAKDSGRGRDTCARGARVHDGGDVPRDVPVATVPMADVVAMFRENDLVTYGDARREFFIQLNLNPFRPRSRAFHEHVEDAFAQWFAFDYHLDVSGLTPFAVAAAYERLDRGDLGERGYRDLCEMSSSNVASWFWVRGACAGSGVVTVEDLAHGGVFDVRDRAAARRFDGACGGTIIGRVAEVRGVWRMPWATLYEAHTPDDDAFRAHVAASLRAWEPGYVDYARLLFGRDRRLKVDWEEVAASR